MTAEGDKNAARSSNSGAFLLLAGVAAGGFLALAGAASRPGALSTEDAALVNGVGVPRRPIDQQIALKEAELARPLSIEERAYLLEQGIEQELLIQRGLELGLARSERSVRAAISRAMISYATAHADAQPVPAEELEAFYLKNRRLFAPPPQLRVRRIIVPHTDEGGRDGGSADVEARAAALRESLAASAPLDASFMDSAFLDALVADAGAKVATDVPDRLLTPAKLRDYLGPDVLRLLETMAAGEVSPVRKARDGWEMLMLAERASPPAPPLEAMRNVVEDAYARARADEALGAYINDLKRRGDIVRAPDFRE